jgi:hypothetical protein
LPKRSTPATPSAIPAPLPLVAEAAGQDGHFGTGIGSSPASGGGWEGEGSGLARRSISALRSPHPNPPHKWGGGKPFAEGNGAAQAKHSGDPIGDTRSSTACWGGCRAGWPLRNRHRLLPRLRGRLGGGGNGLARRSMSALRSPHPNPPHKWGGGKPLADGNGAAQAKHSGDPIGDTRSSPARCGGCWAEWPLWNRHRLLPRSRGRLGGGGSRQPGISASAV